MTLLQKNSKSEDESAVELALGKLTDVDDIMDSIESNFQLLNFTNEDDRALIRMELDEAKNHFQHAVDNLYESNGSPSETQRQKIINYLYKVSENLEAFMGVVIGKVDDGMMEQEEVSSRAVQNITTVLGKIDNALVDLDPDYTTRGKERQSIHEHIDDYRRRVWSLHQREQAQKPKARDPWTGTVGRVS